MLESLEKCKIGLRGRVVEELEIEPVVRGSEIW